MTAADLPAMDLRELASAVLTGAISYEQVATEYARRAAAGLDPDTGRAPKPVCASAVVIPAITCPTCRSLLRAPVTSSEVQSCR